MLVIALFVAFVSADYELPRFGENQIQSLFIERQPAVILLTREEEVHSDYFNNFSAVAEKMESQISFFYSGVVGSGFEGHLGEYLNYRQEALPVVLIVIDIDGTKHKKWIFEGGDLTTFVTDFLTNL